MAAVAHPIRPHIRRNSPLRGHRQAFGTSNDLPALKRVVLDDSDSDSEPPPAIKFSKVTQALLDDAPVPPSPQRQERISEAPLHKASIIGSKAGLDTPSRAPGIKIVRKSSPSVLGQERGNTPPRIVQVGKSSGSAARSISISGPYPQRPAARREPTPEVAPKPEIVTPAQASRAVRAMRSRAGSNASQDGQSYRPSALSRPGSRNGLNAGADLQDQDKYASDGSRNASINAAAEAVARYGSSTINRSRNISGDGPGAPGSQRVKRAPLGTGSYLRSMPARRFKRRDSEDNISPTDDAQNASATQASATKYTPRDGSLSGIEGPRSRSGSVNTRATSVDPISAHDIAAKSQGSHDYRNGNPYLSRSQTSDRSRPPSRQTSREHLRSRQPSVDRYQQPRRPSVSTADAIPSIEPQHQPRSSFEQPQPEHSYEPKPPQRVPSLNRVQYRYIAPKIHTDTSEDQENMPPPTFKRNKDQDFKYLGQRHIAVLSDDDKPKPRLIDETPVPVPPHERKALGTISGNTPHRPAPAPPPKMSVLDAATTTAGASVTKSKKKRTHIVVNGKIFTQMGKIGKGGSSDVYCVMAENYKTFALKRVKLADCDESAVRGYKGEIDLLRKLTEVERVVRLFDWELNEEKQELSVLMEKGDTDLNRILTLRINGTEAKFDSAFTRYYWREMLECVQAVHDHDIVHSDLKPANFLLVQGKLKLIDFGIANAIDTDNTCNVHRDSHVGTPNYMSPESITDTNASSSGGSGANKDAQGRPLKKDMRIGKASDVWSLGCILYQMTYGRPPFAHIQNQISRIMAITNPKHVIEFPPTGINGSFVPPALRLTLRKCLNRNPDLRPTVKQLLSDEDPFMNPEGDRKDGSAPVTEHMLSQILFRVVEKCKQEVPPSQAEIAVWSRAYMEKLREHAAGG